MIERRPLTLAPDQQAAWLNDLLLTQNWVRTIKDRRREIGLKDWAIGAGALAQTVWNHLDRRPPLYGIKDLDFVYFDAADLSEAAEAESARRMAALLADLPLTLDVKNQARVHLWYRRRFGYAIAPYRTIGEAIATWPTTATAVAVSYDRAGDMTLWAPFGLSDLLSGIVRPNPTQITRDVYEAKIERWRALWPNLSYRAWER
jgi:hypothetical protein